MFLNCLTGIFTAPVKGVYYFRFYAHSHAGTKMAVSLLKNGQMQSSVFSWKPVTNGNASNGVILTLEPGDQVYTQLWDKSWVYDDEANYTSFSGFLIFPLWMSEDASWRVCSEDHDISWIKKELSDIWNSNIDIWIICELFQVMVRFCYQIKNYSNTKWDLCAYSKFLFFESIFKVPFIATLFK